MVSADVIAIIGPDTSLTSGLVNPVFAGLHIPHILPLASDPTIDLQENPYTIRVCENFMKPYVKSDNKCEYAGAGTAV